MKILISWDNLHYFLATSGAHTDLAYSSWIGNIYCTRWNIHVANMSFCQSAERKTVNIYSGGTKNNYVHFLPSDNFQFWYFTTVTVEE